MKKAVVWQKLLHTRRGRSRSGAAGPRGRALPESRNISPIGQDKRGRGKVRGQNHIFAPRCDLRMYLITCPTQLRTFCEVTKKIKFDNSENPSTQTEDRKKLFRPPAVPPIPPIAKHRYVVRHISGHPPAKFGRRAGPGRDRKTGSKFGEPPKKLPHF
jgi:hypothetical protein